MDFQISDLKEELRILSKEKEEVDRDNNKKQYKI
jgi:hypothetical protein